MARAATRGSLNTDTSRAIPEGSRPCLHRQSKGDRRARTRRGIYRCVAMSHLGAGFSPSIFDGGSDARTALDDAVRHGNNPDRCTCTGSDVRSTLPGLHAGLQQRRQLDRVWLYIDGRVCSVGVRPRSSVLRQPILCAYRQESVSQGLSASAGPSTRPQVI